MIEPVENRKFSERMQLRVAASSNSKDLAGSIAKLYQDNKECDLIAIGHAAVCQALKAVPIANGYLAPQGIVLVVLPSFENKLLDDGAGTPVERTLLRMRLMKYSF